MTGLEIIKEMLKGAEVIEKGTGLKGTISIITKKETLERIEVDLQQAEKDKIIADFVRKHYKVSNNINGNFLELVKPYTNDECNKVNEVFEKWKYLKQYYYLCLF